MIGLFLPRPYRLQLKVVVLLALLLGALGLRSCTDPAPAWPTCTIHTSPAPAGEAVLPVAFRLPFPSGRWLRLLDTARVGGRANLLRKTSPRSQWLPAQPAYLPRLHRRPRQWVLDSLAAASMRRI